MPDVRPPDCIVLAVHRDNRHRVERAMRWVLVAGLTALALAGLANAFGQRHAQVLGTGDGATLALTAPAALRSRDGRVAYAFPTLPVGSTMTVYVDLQVNPTTAGRRPQGVELRDGNRTIASIDRTVNVFP